MNISVAGISRRWAHSLLVAMLLAQVIALRQIDAMLADGAPFEFIQPDGTKVLLRLKGDEFFHWHEDMGGFTVVRSGDTFVYAKLGATGQLEATSLVAGKVDPSTAGLAARQLPEKRLRPINTNAEQLPNRPWERIAAAKARSAGGMNPNNTVASGTVKNLVILCLFSNHTVAANARPQSDYNVLYNQVGGDTTIAPTGSVYDAYKTMSYGIVNLQSTVLAWVTLPHDMAYYAGSNNDGYIDAIDIIHSGYGAEQGGAPANSIWSVKSSLPSDWVSADNNANGVKVKVKLYHTEPALWGASGTAILHIGVICHETGHFFGLPDLYDTDNSSDGIGSWCMMANSWGFDGTQLRPPDYSAWCKIFLGWVTPTVLNAPGNYSIAQAETNKAVYRINRGFTPSEYLLIENRQPAGLETVMPQGGLAIWHIDESLSTNTNEGYPGQAGWPGNGNHYKVALLQADGRYDLEKIAHPSAAQRGDATDVYRASTTSAVGMNTTPTTDRYKLGTAGPTANRITNISAEGATMTFDYSFPNSVLYVDANYNGSPTGGADQPYKRVIDAYNAAQDGDTIVIRSANYLDAPMTNLTKKVAFDSRLGSSTVK